MQPFYSGNVCVFDFLVVSSAWRAFVIVYSVSLRSLEIPHSMIVHQDNYSSIKKTRAAVI